VGTTGAVGDKNVEKVDSLGRSTLDVIDQHQPVITMDRTVGRVRHHWS
jgi:hypothetical protein